MPQIVLQNRRVWDAVAHEYNSCELYSAEQRLLSLFRGQDLKMLDLGVGAGRTAYTFAPLAQEYVGLDYASAMIERCKRVFPPCEHVKFLEGDARDLSRFPPDYFDVVLFSYNGIDYGEMEDRIRILSQVRRVLKPGGVFLFSSHSLRAFPCAGFVPRWSWKRPLRGVRRRWKRWKFCRRIEFENRGQDIEQARNRGWALVTDGAHNFTLKTMYVTPAFQCAQLQAEGYEVQSVLDGRSRVIAATTVTDDCWLHYMCRKP